MRLPHFLMLYIMVLITQTSLMAQDESTYAIVIHGGAGGDPSRWSEEYRQLRLDGLSAALDHGCQMLADDANALDVVEQVVRLMEDNPIFNAGRGCVLNEKGQHELDASIMDGESLACGAVASVKLAKHPISLARRVMTDTKHVLLIGTGADEFGEAVGIEQAPVEHFVTERQKDKWEKWKRREPDISLFRPKHIHAPNDSTVTDGDDQELYMGTVGCVVLDSHGNLAAGTSTGGLMGKRWGRVGDSPIIGAGTYADNRTCAVSGTGIGEEFIRHNVAGDIAARMRYAGETLKAAAGNTLEELPEDCGGVICIDPDGNIVIEFNTPGMSRAYANAAGNRKVAL